MKKRTRQIIFYIAVLLFVLIGSGAILFALGYKYDFVQNKLLKTGSLELESNVSAEVYINDEFEGDTSFLRDSFSKGRLLPRTYRLRLRRDGYQPWQKLVKIEVGLLASFPRVVLLSDNFEEETIASSSIKNVTIRKFDSQNNLAIIGNKLKQETINLRSGEKKEVKPQAAEQTKLEKVTGFEQIIAPDEGKVAWSNGYEIWVQWLKNASYQPYKLTEEKEFITRFSQKIDSVQWYKDSAHLIVSAGNVLKFVEIDNRGGVNIFDLSAISGPFLYDSDQNTIFKFEGVKLIRIYLK